MTLAKSFLLAAAGAATAAYFARRKRRQTLSMDQQLGGYAGGFASPGLGVDDADEATSGFSHRVLRRQVS